VTDATKPGSPHLVTAILTLVVACFAFVSYGRTYQYRWEYPYLSLEDPAKSIFLWAEYERRLAMHWPAAMPFAPPSLRDAGEAWVELNVEAMRAGVAPSDDKLGADVGIAGARVVAAGWGLPDSIAVVRGMDEAEVPEYLVERIQQIKRGDTEKDDVRARGALGWHVSSLAFQSFGVAMLLALPLLLWRWRRRRAPAGEGEAGKIVGFGLAQAWILLTWSLAALALAWRFYWVDVPILSDIGGTFPSLLLALVGLVLVRDTRASDSPAPLRRMFSLPNESGTKRRWFVLAFAAYGATSIFSYLTNWGFAALGMGAPWSEFLLEPMIYGSSALAFATALELVVFAPLGEELMFRGVLFGALASKLSTHRAALISAILFGAWHGYGLAGTVVVAFDGYLMARLYARTRSLIPGMLLHAAINFGITLNDLGCRA
jgi:membrane protease YdiL (CAAX protease family)